MKTNTIQLSSKNAFICQVPYKRIHTYSKSLARLNQGQHKRLAEEKTQEASMENTRSPNGKTQEATMEQHNALYGTT